MFLVTLDPTPKYLRPLIHVKSPLLSTKGATLITVLLCELFCLQPLNPSRRRLVQHSYSCEFPPYSVPVSPFSSSDVDSAISTSSETFLCTPHLNANPQPIILRQRSLKEVSEEEAEQRGIDWPCLR